MKKSEIMIGLLRIPVDFIMTILAFLLAYKIRTITDLIPGIQFPTDLSVFPPLNEYTQFATFASMALVGIFAFNNLYSLKNTINFRREFGRIIFGSAAWLMAIIAFFFVQHTLPFSRLVLGYSWIFSIIFISIGRAIIRIIQQQLLRIGIGTRRVLVIGESQFSIELTRELKKNPRYKLIGFITEKKEPKDKKLFLGTISDLKNIIKKRKIDEIIQAQSHLSDASAKEILSLSREHHVDYSFVPDLIEVQRTNVEMFSIGNTPIIALKPTPIDGWGRVIKRIFDIIGSIIGIIISTPIILMAAIAIKLDSKGPIFFTRLDDGSRSMRIGQKGRGIPYFKLRTMQINSHHLRYTKLAEHNMRKGSPVVKIKNDPRITRVGKFLRRFSIDELPQFWSVLIGDMSLVGPRPHLPEEVEQYDRHHKFVLAIKPGITGLAQVNGRSDLDFEEEIRFDTFYIQNWSIWLDTKILMRTLLVILKGYRE